MAPSEGVQTMTSHRDPAEQPTRLADRHALARTALADLSTSLEFYVREYLLHHGMDAGGLSVRASGHAAAHPEVRGEVLVVEVRLPARLSRAG